MAFKGRPTGHFRDDERWSPASDAVAFTLDVADDNGHHEILCRITSKALADIAHRDQLSGLAAVRCYRAYRHQVRAKVNEKFTMALFEPDGSITVRRSDVNL